MSTSIVRRASTYLLVLFPKVLEFVRRATIARDRLYSVMDVLFQPMYYVFFKDSAQPYPLHWINNRATGSAQTYLVYNAETKRFFEWDSSTGETLTEGEYLTPNMPIPVLSLEILDRDDKVHYDLTDYIESMSLTESITTKVRYPLSIQHIVAVWSQSSRIIPDKDRFYLRYVNSSGETLVTDIRFYTTAEPSPVLLQEPEEDESTPSTPVKEDEAAAPAEAASDAAVQPVAAPLLSTDYKFPIEVFNDIMTTGGTLTMDGPDAWPASDTMHRVVFLGAAGSGKSTACAALLGKEVNHDLDTMAFSEYVNAKDKMIYIFDSPGAFPAHYTNRARHYILFSDKFLTQEQLNSFLPGTSFKRFTTQEKLKEYLDSL